LNLPITNFSQDFDSLRKLEIILNKILKPENYFNCFVKIQHLKRKKNENKNYKKDFILRLIGNYEHL
jgi:hypothetical protein